MADLKAFVLSFLFCLLLQCAPSLQAEAMVFVADYSGAGIFMADFSSDGLDSITFDALPFDSVVQPYGVDYDPDTRMVYWTQYSGPGSIRRANINGSMQSVIVDSTNARYPYDLALDTSRGKVFWTDNFQNRIMSANLNGSSQQILINTGLYYPCGIIVHKEKGLMFWTDYYYDKIERANLDGGDRNVIVSSGLSYPTGLEFNANGSRVYWCDYGTDKIESVDLWGNDRMVHLATASIAPWDLAVVDDSIIWTQLSAALGVTSTNSSNGYSFYYHNIFSYPRGIHVYREEIPTTTEVYNPTTRQANTEADLTCDSVSMTLIMDRTLLEISDDARDVHFEDESCVGYDHDSQHVAITTMYDGCGTTQKQDDDYIIFTNKVTYYKPRPENGTDELITRKHNLQIPVTCYLERTQVLEDSFLPEANVRVFEKKGYGDFSLNLYRYTNSGFYQPANDSGEVTLGTPLYFGVRLTSVTNLTLLIESCWATSSLDPQDDHRYDIIEKGCAVDSTTVIYNWASSTFKGFSIDAFTFIGDNDEVYVHCSILICDNTDSGSRCAQGCLPRSRRSLKDTGFQSKLHTITNGPLSDASRSQRAMLLDSVYDL